MSHTSAERDIAAELCPRLPLPSVWFKPRLQWISRNARPLFLRCVTSLFMGAIRNETAVETWESITGYGCPGGHRLQWTADGAPLISGVPHHSPGAGGSRRAAATRWRRLITMLNSSYKAPSLWATLMSAGSLADKPRPFTQHLDRLWNSAGESWRRTVWWILTVEERSPSESRFILAHSIINGCNSWCKFSENSAGMFIYLF